MDIPRCNSCMYWKVSTKSPALMVCEADTNHIGLIGPTFYCANHTVGKHKGK